MKYELIKKSAIYTFIVVTIAMTILGVLAVWGMLGDDVLWRSFTTILVVGFGCVVTAYAAGLVDNEPEQKEALPSFAPYPKPKPRSEQVPPPPGHIT